MSVARTEARVLEAVRGRRDDLVGLACDLIRLDTTARGPGDPPRDERALQELLAARLGAAGAEVDLFEPDPVRLAGRPLVPAGLSFEGRPQLVARFPGAGGGRSLLLNGHVDAVTPEPVERWRSHPLRPEVREGRLYGRGACDMKGGIAAIVVAVETLAALGVRLEGDLVVATNTDEESSGAGGAALVEHGVAADAAIVAEPTGFDVWVACRGSSYATVTVPGRPGHAEVRHAGWREGGAVNAIEKAGVVLAAIAGLRAEWAGRPELQHPHLSPPDLVPTMISAGEWPVTYPAECRLTCALLFLPGQADEAGFGHSVEREVETRLARAAAADDWLAEHPPVVAWDDNRVMATELPAGEPIVETMLAATTAVGRPGRPSGLDSWYDGATFTRMGGTPSVAFGPAGFTKGGASVAHTIDEHVRVDDLVDCACALALASLRFCGEAR